VRQTQEYRADIDGLRALSVLGVVFFHVGFAPFRGGYVGVDVFFVISGFLITGLIRNEVLAGGAFRFSDFYLRRARRLLPALFFTLGVSFVAAFAWFSPDDMRRFSGSLLNAVASLSNFYFWGQAGYFDTESSVKPLLHTWSLGVEEQFYLLWPAFLVLLLTKARRFAVPTLAVGGLVSLLLNLLFGDGSAAGLGTWSPAAARWFADGPVTIYYLLPFRIFEFAIGASAVWLVERPAPKRARAQLWALGGLAMIAFAMVSYTEETVFPSVAALPPCLGTAMIIHARSGTWLNRLLAHRVLVGLGLISYSLYLIHWPIIVFYRHATGSSLSTAESWAIIGLSIGAAIAMYRWVEMPFRYTGVAVRRWSPAGFGLGCALSALVLTIVSANSWANQGWTWRFGESRAVRAFGEIDELRLQRENALNRLRSADFDGSKTRVLVVGDSLADDLVLGLAASLGDGFDVQHDAYRPLCFAAFSNDPDPQDRACADLESALDRSIKIPTADAVFITFRVLPDFYEPSFSPLVSYLRQRVRPGVPITLLGRGAEFPGFQSVAVSMLADGASIQQIEAQARQVAGSPEPLDSQMREAARRLGIGFISKFDALCDTAVCDYFTDDGEMMFWDKAHMTVAGARVYGARIAANLGRDFVARVGAAHAERRAAGGDAPQQVQSVAFEEIPIEEAREILDEFDAALSRFDLDGDTLFDAAALSHPKDRIRTAIVTLLRHAPAGARAPFETAVLRLDFFQPGIGDRHVGLGDPGPDELPWRSTVEAEMRRAVMALAEQAP